ncbi:unnamed protein product [Effrenium voratum]|nr:unnamed protein product [Effrenium voratum]
MLRCFCSLFCLSLTRSHQTPDDLTQEVQLAKEDVCQPWALQRDAWRRNWAAQPPDARRAHLLDSAPNLPKARGVPRTASGEDVEGFAELCPELNLEELSSNANVLLNLLDERCASEMASQRRIQDADLALARQLADGGKIGRRIASRKLFYLREDSKGLDWLIT